MNVCLLLIRCLLQLNCAQVLGCTILQVGSTDDAATSSSYDKLADDLRVLADEAAKQSPPITMYIFHFFT
jgi:hypothetical protein